MQKDRMFLIVGVWTAVLPYLGFPNSWKDVLFTLTGLFIMYSSYVMHEERKREEGTTKTFDNFRENSPLENK